MGSKQAVLNWPSSAFHLIMEILENKHSINNYHNICTYWEGELWHNKTCKNSPKLSRIKIEYESSWPLIPNLEPSLWDGPFDFEGGVGWLKKNNWQGFLYQKNFMTIVHSRSMLHEEKNIVRTYNLRKKLPTEYTWGMKKIVPGYQITPHNPLKVK